MLSITSFSSPQWFQTHKQGNMCLWCLDSWNKTEHSGENMNYIITLWNSDHHNKWIWGEWMLEKWNGFCWTVDWLLPVGHSEIRNLQQWLHNKVSHWICNFSSSSIWLFRLGGADVMDYLYKGQPSIWRGSGVWSEWECSQLQSIAEQFAQSFDYQHFSQFPCALESLPKRQFMHIRESFKKTPASLAQARYLTKRFPPTAKEQWTNWK